MLLIDIQQSVRPHGRMLFQLDTTMAIHSECRMSLYGKRAREVS